MFNEFGKIFLICLQSEFGFKLDKMSSKLELINLYMFIGELYHTNIINQGITIYCLDQLVKYSSEQRGNQQDYTETIIKFLLTYGELVDKRVRDVSKTHRYYEWIEKNVLGREPNSYPVRIKFMASDLMKLRKVHFFKVNSNLFLSNKAFEII
jgi:hypothetical protein